MKTCFYILIAIVLFVSCKKPYNPPAITASYNYLVVEGLINIGQDSTIITLSRSVSVSSNSTVNPELNAVVTIENDGNNSYSLKSIGNGQYAIPAINGDTVHKYRLRIKTSDNNEYLSDFVQAKITPPIDSVSHQYAATAENIFVYTHDPANRTRYYRWEYQETYLYYSPVTSGFVYKNNNIVATTAADEISTCYISDTSSNILLNSTAKLSQDIINRQPITTIPFSLDKLKIRYTILVKQYGLTADAYNFYHTLSTNTEKIGSIFDVQPSESGGNIHCITNASQAVIGYVAAGTVAQERIFIDRADLPPTNIGVDYSYCGGVAGISWGGSYNLIPSFIKFGPDAPTSGISKGADSKGDSVFSVSYGDATCIVCTLKGSDQKPAFWK